MQSEIAAAVHFLQLAIELQQAAASELRNFPAGHPVQVERLLEEHLLHPGAADLQHNLSTLNHPVEQAEHSVGVEQSEQPTT